MPLRSPKTGSLAGECGGVGPHSLVPAPRDVTGGEFSFNFLLKTGDVTVKIDRVPDTGLGCARAHRYMYIFIVYIYIVYILIYTLICIHTLIYICMYVYKYRTKENHRHTFGVKTIYTESL